MTCHEEEELTGITFPSTVFFLVNIRTSQRAWNSPINIINITVNNIIITTTNNNIKMIKMMMMIMEHHDGNLTIVTSSFRCSLFSSRLPSSSDLMVKNLIIIKKKKTEINLSKISLEIQNSPHAHSFFPPLGFSSPPLPCSTCSPPPPPSSPPPPPHPPWHLAWKVQTNRQSLQFYDELKS